MLTPEEEKKKREIFEAMLPRRQQRILKKGYENWNPFQRPKEPWQQIKRQGENQKRSLNLYHLFFSKRQNENYSNDYVQGVIEMCQGIIKDDDRYRGMYDFCCWYREKGRENT